MKSKKQPRINLKQDKQDKQETDKKFLQKAKLEEIDYLKHVKSTKPIRKENPLYMSCISACNEKYNGSGKYSKQEGGFIQALLPILRFAGPMILDYAISKFTGKGFSYKYNDGRELTSGDKKKLLLNILIKYPHLADKIFA